MAPERGEGLVLVSVWPLVRYTLVVRMDLSTDKEDRAPYMGLSYLVLTAKTSGRVEGGCSKDMRITIDLICAPAWSFKKMLLADYINDVNNNNNNYTFPVRRLGVHLDHLKIAR
jgi:hypothetical protein